MEAGKPSVVMGAASTVAAGQSTVVPITITNNADTAMTYSVAVTGGDWATYTVTPSSVVMIDAGDTSTVQLTVAAGRNAPAGEQIVGVSVSSAGKAVKDGT